MRSFILVVKWSQISRCVLKVNLLSLVRPNTCIQHKQSYQWAQALNYIYQVCIQWQKGLHLSWHPVTSSTTRDGFKDWRLGQAGCGITPAGPPLFFSMIYVKDVRKKSWVEGSIDWLVLFIVPTHVQEQTSHIFTSAVLLQILRWPKSITPEASPPPLLLLLMNTLLLRPGICVTQRAPSHVNWSDYYSARPISSAAVIGRRVAMQPVSCAQGKALRVKTSRAPAVACCCIITASLCAERGELRSHAGLSTNLSF